jgi:hypothetical protein
MQKMIAKQDATDERQLEHHEEVIGKVDALAEKLEQATVCMRHTHVCTIPI